MALMLLTCIALVAFIILGMAVAMRAGDEKERHRNALAVIRGKHVSVLEEARQKADHNKKKTDISRRLKEQGGSSGTKKVSLAMRLEQAGIKIGVRQFWIFSLLSGLCAAFLMKAMGYSFFVVLMFFIIFLLGVPRFVLRSRIRRRQKKFLEEFADALEAMVRLLKAGMPVGEAISMAGREFSGPVGEEMSRIYDAQKVGVSLSEASYDAARRTDLTEMQMFATGVTIQAQTGASLSEVLLNLAGVIRARYRLRRKVQALSSEAKASAMIIGSLPFLVGGGLFLINPEYINILFTTLPGKIMLIGGAVWMGMGIFIMKAMINFRV